MIIVAYAGAGKSTFAARTDGAADMLCMPCKWILPLVMRPGEYLTDLVPRLEKERRADTTQPVTEKTIRGIEEKLLD